MQFNKHKQTHTRAGLRGYVQFNKCTHAHTHTHKVNEGAQDGNGDGAGTGTGTGVGPVDEHGMGTGTETGLETRTVAEMRAGTAITGTRIGLGRAEGRRKSARNRKIAVDTVRETGETWVESEKNVEKKGLVQ